MPGDTDQFEIDMTALSAFLHEIDMSHENILDAWLDREGMDSILEKIGLDHTSFADKYGRDMVRFFFRVAR